MDSLKADSALPRLIEPQQLETLLPAPPDDGGGGLLVVDVGQSESYQRGHVPGAVHLDYHELILGQPPAPGLPPPPDKLQHALRAIGLNTGQQVVAYDDQGNGRASRLLWTLEAAGHTRCALLNGGLTAWGNEGHKLESGAGPTGVKAETGNFTVACNPAVTAEQDYVLAALDNPKITLLDARSPEEYRGLKSPSARAGHIPGAIHLNWLDTIDPNNNLRFKPEAELRGMLDQRGIGCDREVITYCQTHHRSSHAFAMLRHLGFATLRGYPGSWSQWGNDLAMPIE